MTKETRVVDLQEGRSAVDELCRTIGRDAPPMTADVSGVVALRGDRAVGLLAWNPFPAFDGTEEIYLGTLTDPDSDQPGVEEPLLAAAVDRLGSRRCRAWFHVNDQNRHLEPILGRHGFTHEFTVVTYTGALPLPRTEPRPEARLVEYRGGDEAVDADIEDLHRRGYRGRIGAPEWTPPAPDSHKIHVLAYDGDRLAGFISWVATPEGAVWDNVVLARRYYGTGMAHTLGCAFSDAAVEAGCTLMRGYVHSTNHASRSLAERFGLQVEGEVHSFLRVFPTADVSGG